ncbi:ubiquitin carboxyl-terminal hydrolase 16-like isoform X2 [Mangifera indica]|uniref:ubiquitin carboxyl-terminal hydrolase 16-like isoform X2 n=1 Tax=Mangifera indica TaxID=29780 RepID=UPI001CFBEF7D|nr:ubiquitin carboxyl-terminal hydrolase 16-like isoform X2 [Mangifera indica]
MRCLFLSNYHALCPVQSCSLLILKCFSSGKCQIIHWRQGHKDECYPSSITQDNIDEAAYSTGQEERELDVDRFKFEGRQPPTSIDISSVESAMSYTSTSPEVPYGKDNDVKVELHADGEGASPTCEYSDTSFSGFSASHTGSDSSDDVSVCESISSNESEKLDGPLSAGICVDMLETVSSVKNLNQIKPLSPKFASLVNSVNNFTNLNKLSQIKPSSSGEGTSYSGLNIGQMHEDSNAESCTVSSGFWGRALESTTDAYDDSSLSNSPSCSSNLPPSPSLSVRGPEVKGIVSDDALPEASGRSKDRVTKTSNVDFSQVRSSPSLNCKSSSLTVNGTNVGSHASKSGEVKASVSFSSHAHPSSSVRKDSISVDASNSSSLQSSNLEKSNNVINDNGGSSHHVEVHSVPSVRSGRINDVHATSPLFFRVKNCSSNDENGLKTSLWKAVDQLRSKSLKQHPTGVGSETAGRYSDKGLFSYELFVKLYNWNKVELQPCGLINCGNSCYANAVLQCLTFTPPLTAYFTQGLHSKECVKKEWCFTCEFENLILKAKEGKSPLSPIGILSQLQSIGSKLGNGREEDAHEFLRYAIDTMQSVCLKEARVNDSCLLEEETTLIGLTFGGYLRSKIKCMKCQGKSERQERMMDLTVEIGGDIRSLEEALRQFSGTEILDGDNMYQCGRCKSYQKAKKKLTILEAPNILTIALKRFQSGKFGKLNKSIQFPEILDLAPYMSGTSDKSPIYRLYGVVVHLDIMNAAFSGHYVCYVKSIKNKWFKIDDNTVTPVEREKVLTEGAYMLLYARCSPRASRLIRNRIISSDLKSKVIPSWVTGKSTTSKLRSPSMHSSADQSYPSSIPPDGFASIESFYSRFHQLQKILQEDSSDSSSLISSNSDEGSCSTDNTRDSSSTDDISDYIFGDSGSGWNSRWRNCSDSDSSSLSSWHSAFSNSEQADNTGSGMEGAAGHSTSNRQVDLVGRGNASILHYDTTNKQCRKLASSSCRDRLRELRMD